MFGIHDFFIFIISGFLLNIAPGPDSIFIMTKSASAGWKAGVTATLGVCSGGFIHVCAAVLGLSALLQSSGIAFTCVKLVGAAYLVYMGLTGLRSLKEITSSSRKNKLVSPKQKLITIYRQGFLTNVLNPKVALFFMAFVPQFIDQNAENKPFSFIILGTLFIFNSMIYSIILATLTSMVTEKTNISASVKKLLNGTASLTFVGLGIKLALTSRS